MNVILIIENNSDLLVKYTSILKDYRYEVISAQNSDIGINIAITKLPNLILCNNILYKRDGYEILSILSVNPLTSKTPFIFINSESTPNDVKKGIELGADDFITKPFQGNQLLRSVKANINKCKINKWSLLPLIELDSLKIPNTKVLEKLQELISNSKMRHIKKKQTLYFEGDYSQWVYLLVKGCIKRLKLTNDGRELITDLYKPNNFIGLDNLLLDIPFSHNAEATENSSLYFISKVAVLELLNEHAELNQCFIKILSIDLHEKENKLVELAYESVRKRIAQAIIRLIKNAVPIDQLDISRDELAGVAGVAKETVSRILSDFKDKGLIKRYGSHIQIIDYDGLLNMKI